MRRRATGRSARRRGEPASVEDLRPLPARVRWCVEYFDWAATLAPLLVLGAWAAGGLVVGLLGERYGPHVRATA